MTDKELRSDNRRLQALLREAREKIDLLEGPLKDKEMSELRSIIAIQSIQIKDLKGELEQVKEELEKPKSFYPTPRRRVRGRRRF